MIKAIETRYKGYRFRSRLEARWAVFFDALGIEWEYEKEGFDLGVHGWYLPDFWLPKHGIWIEIKPVVIINEDVGDFLGNESLWEDVKHIVASKEEWEKISCRLPGGPTVVIGGNPGLLWDDYITRDMGDEDSTICADLGGWCTCYECGFVYFGYVEGDDRDWCGYPFISCCDKCGDAHSKERLRMSYKSDKILDAIKAARSARFGLGGRG